MPEAEPAELRIHCICGQKMRVSAAMYGQRGKCIACRQKIRIPRPVELPEGAEDIYLKDHPEFLRKPDKARKSADKPARKAEKVDYVEDIADVAEAVRAAQEEEALGAPEIIPLEVLEPLRLLCNFDHKIRRQINDLERGGRRGENDSDKSALISYRVLVQKVRKGLDRQMAARLEETEEKLSGVREHIGRICLATRIGEMEYDAFLEAVVPLRQRRERLALRLRNLEGWLAVTDPAVAGGFMDVKLDDAPCEAIEVTFPGEPRSDQGVVEHCIVRLRDTLRRHEQAELKLKERKRIDSEGDVSGKSLDDAHRDCEAARERARSTVDFYRERLGQLDQDCTGDIRIVKAQMEQAWDKLQKEELEKKAYQGLEMTLLRSQADNTKTRALIKRALAVRTARDVPRPHGTFLRRMARPGRPGDVGTDSIIAWVASALLLLIIFVPMSGAPDGANRAGVGMTIALLLTASALAMSAALPRRDLRGMLFGAIWVISCIGGAAGVHEAWYSLGPAGAAMRADPQWLLKPGILLLAVAELLVGAAAFSAIGQIRRLRRVPVAAAAIAILGVLAVVTNLGGLITAKPYLAGPAYDFAPQGNGMYTVDITVGNRGWRSMWLGRQTLGVPTSVDFFIERQIGADSWRDIPFPVNDGAESPGPAGIKIGAGETLQLQYTLLHGTYRMQLTWGHAVKRTIEKPFTLAPPSGPGGTWDDMGFIRLQQDVPGATDDTEPVRNTRLKTEQVEIELRGVVRGFGADPMFSLLLHLPDGRNVERRLGLGKQLYGPWKTYEYSPQRQSLTITDGEKLLIIHVGKSLSVDVAE